MSGNGKPWWERLVRAVADDVALLTGEEAADLYGAAALELVRRLPQYDARRGDLTAFIVRRAKYAMLDHVRAWRHHRRKGHSHSEVRMLPIGAAARMGRADGQEAGVLRREVWEAVATLPERWQLILRWYYDDGLTQIECSERLGIGQSRVSQIRRAAVQRLRVALGVA